MARAATVDRSSGPETRERILQAALEVFSENGYDGAKTREIATRADVNLGLLQYHFGGKEKLWKAAVDEAFFEIKSGLDAILEDPRPGNERERLRLMIRSHVRFAARRPEFLRIMHDEGKRRGPRMRWLVDRHVKPVHVPARELIARCQDSGVLPPGIDPTHLLYALLGAVGLFFHQEEECKRLSGIDTRDEAAVEAHCRAVEHIFLGPEPAHDD